jgi:hypothetical protein
MADTARSLSDLQALLADNATGDISPQDLRDFLVTSLGVYGGIYVSDGAAAQGSIDTSYTKITGFAGDAASSDTTPDHTADTITIGVTGIYFVMANLSFSGTASVTFSVALYSQGVEQDIHFARTISTGGDVGAAGLSGLISLTAADVLDLRIKASSGSGRSITLVQGNFSVRMVG